MKLRKALLSLAFVIATYALVLLQWPWTVEDHWKDPYLGPLLPVLDFLSLNHRLRLYLPDPPLDSLRCRIELDGQEWKFPRRRLLPWDPNDSFDRYATAYLTWHEADRAPRPPAYWSDLARYVARQAHPGIVRLIAEIEPIPPAGEHSQPASWMTRSVLLFSQDTSR